MEGGDILCLNAFFFFHFQRQDTGLKPFSVTKSILEINHFTTVDTAVFQCYNDYKDYSCQGQIVGL